MVAMWAIFWKIDEEIGHGREEVHKLPRYVKFMDDEGETVIQHNDDSESTFHEFLM